MTEEKEITDQQFKRLMVLGMQVMSSHLCHIALGTKSIQFQTGGKSTHKPMSETDAFYHMGLQKRLNEMLDKTLGTDEEDEGLKPTLVVDNDKPANDEGIDYKGFSIGAKVRHGSEADQYESIVVDMVIVDKEVTELVVFQDGREDRTLNLPVSHAQLVTE